MGKNKNVDPAEIKRRLAVLEPELERLKQAADAETDPKKKLKLGVKIDKTRDKIRQAKTGEMCIRDRDGSHPEAEAGACRGCRNCGQAAARRIPHR